MAAMHEPDPRHWESRTKPPSTRGEGMTETTTLSRATIKSIYEHMVRIRKSEERVQIGRASCRERV